MSHLPESKDKLKVSLGDPVRAVPAWFLDAMTAKLEANAFKGSWREVPLPKLFELLQEEVRELAVAIQRLRREGWDPVTEAEVIAEAADVANFAMFFADLAKLGAWRD
jgi:NTP pyrophosphatase (non-canonical NTP hydrolase)